MPEAARAVKDREGCTDRGLNAGIGLVAGSGPGSAVLCYKLSRSVTNWAAMTEEGVSPWAIRDGSELSGFRGFDLAPPVVDF